MSNFVDSLGIEKVPGPSNKFCGSEKSQNVFSINKSNSITKALIKKNSAHESLCSTICTNLWPKVRAHIGLVKIYPTPKFYRTGIFLYLFHSEMRYDKIRARLLLA